MAAIEAVISNEGASSPRHWPFRAGFVLVALSCALVAFMQVLVGLRGTGAIGLTLLGATALPVSAQWQAALAPLLNLLFFWGLLALVGRRLYLMARARSFVRSGWLPMFTIAIRPPGANGACYQ